MADLSGLIELGKAWGPSGLLFGLLYLFMRMDEKKWSRQRDDDKENQKLQSAAESAKWATLVDQQKNMVTQVLDQHKAERDRDFKHLQDQMEFIHGQHATQTAMVTTLAAVNATVTDLKRSADQWPIYVRDLHARLDALADKEKKP